jgi:hypothetical protein
MPLGSRVPTEPSLAKAPPSTPIAFSVDDAEGNRIRSDGGGEYVNGLQAVSATIDGYGNLDVSNTASSTPDRRLTFDYSVPTDPSNPFVVPTGQRWFRIKSNKAATGAPGLTLLTVGASACYGVLFAHGDGVTQVRDDFNTAAYGAATFAAVTRTSATTWEMTTTGTCGANAGWAAVVTQDVSRRNQPLVFRGYWDMRTRVTIRSF